MCQVPAKKVATPTKDSTAAMAELQDDIGDVLEGEERCDTNVSGVGMGWGKVATDIVCFQTDGFPECQVDS